MPETQPETQIECRHHWLLGQPVEGAISATCRHCGAARSYPAVLDDLDPGIDTETRQPSDGAATAARRGAAVGARLIGQPQNVI